MKRKAFNFFASYYNVAKELSDKDRLAFYDALMLEQFTGVKTDLKGMAKFAYLSQRHSIDAQINGFNQRLKRGDTSLQPLSMSAPMAGGNVGGSLQGEEEEKEEEDIYNKLIDKTSLIDCEKLFIEKTLNNWSEYYAKQEASKFYNFYGSKNWMVGKNKMKSLPHAIGGWISRCDQEKTIKPQPQKFKEIF